MNGYFVKTIAILELVTAALVFVLAVAGARAWHIDSGEGGAFGAFGFALFLPLSLALLLAGLAVLRRWRSRLAYQSLPLLVTTIVVCLLRWLD